jgi:L,D-peptidoglycan transpeptidase YkuD (ErfK/YbiS/YcfS/YnhG family)
VTPVDAAPALLAGAPQLVLGVTDGWDDTAITLTRYQRDGAGWRAVGAPVAAVAGHAGLAWGRGLHPAQPGRQKEEGDGRSPAGAFAIGGAFGFAAAPPAGTALPYAQLGDAWRCVDDPASAHYNRLFDASGVAVDWRSAEEMMELGELHRWVVFVEHNPDAVRDGGSCIFFHVWSGRGGATLGCTALDEEALAAMIAWLRPGAVYVLLPRAEREALAVGWGLP